MAGEMPSEGNVGANYPHFPESFFEMQVKMQVGQNAYETDVLTAIKTDQREIFYDVVGIQPANNKTLLRTHIESEDSGSSLREGFTEPSGGTRAESEDSRSRLPEGSGEASGGTVTKTQSHDASRLPEASEQSIAQASGESNAIETAVLKTTLKRLVEQVSSALPNSHMRLKNFVQFS